MYVRVWVRVCVCGDHLNRCKNFYPMMSVLLLVRFSVFRFVMLCQFKCSFQSIFNLEQGVDAWSGSHPPTKTLPFHGDMTKGRLCHVPASFSDMGCG